MHNAFPVRLRHAAALLIGATALFATARPAAATPIEFNASTLGCFTSNGGSCASYTSTPTHSSGLSFVGVANLGTPLPDVEPNTSDSQVVTLGSFSVPSTGNIPASSPLNIDFILQVTFSLPAITVPAGGSTTYTADVVGKVSGGSDSNGIQIDFGGAQTLQFAGGSFQLVVNDPGLISDSFRTRTLTGTIQNVITGGTAPVSAVPEPASLVLVGTGLIGAGIRARRKKQ